MPQVPRSIIKNRAKKLREHGKKLLSEYLKKQIGSTAKILVEQSNLTGSLGKSQHFVKVHINEQLLQG